MNQPFDREHEQRATGNLIVFEAVRVRSGPIWRMLKLAKTALLLWGGVSLAGVAAAAVFYGQGVLPLPPQTSATGLDHPALASPSAREEISGPRAGRPDSISRVHPASVPEASVPAVPPPPLAAPVQTSPEPLSERLARRSAARPEASPPVAGWPGAPPLGSAVPHVLPDASQARAVAEARVPRARPEAPIITGSIERHDFSRARRRYRRLHEFGIPRPYSDPYLAFLQQYRYARREFLYRR